MILSWEEDLCEGEMVDTLKKDVATYKENSLEKQKIFYLWFWGGENSTTEPPMLLSIIFDDVGKMRGFRKIIYNIYIVFCLLQ